MQRLKLLNEHAGICGFCRGPIADWDFVVDHTKPLWLDGSNAPSNLSPMHRRCHAEKTRREAALRGKSNRVRRRHELHLERMKRKCT